MENYKKIGIVFEKKKDGQYAYKTTKILDDNSKILDNSVELELDVTKFENIKANKDTSFVMRENEDKPYVIMALSEKLYKGIYDSLKSEGYDDEKIHDAIIKLFEEHSKNIESIKTEKKGDLIGFNLNFNKKELEANKSGSSTRKTKAEIESIDISNINPVDIISKVKSKVVAQDKAVETIVNNIYNNQVIIESNNEDTIKASKASILMDGPTGTGKTLILNEVAKELKLPLIIRSSTMFSAAGYKGSDLSELLVALLEKTGGNLELAERGVIVLDEFDKLGNNEKNDLEMKLAVQQEMLAYLSGGKFPVEFNGKTYEFDTSKITFVCLGAFTDMRERKIETELDENGKYSVKPEDYINEGLLREIVGRFTLITSTRSLNKQDLIKILNESTISPIYQLKKMAKEMYNVDIEYNDEIVDKIAEEAVKDDTGARALQTIVNGIRNVILSELIARKTTKIEINDEILEKYKEVYIRETSMTKEERKV